MKFILIYEKISFSYREYYVFWFIFHKHDIKRTDFGRKFSLYYKFKSYVLINL